MSKHLDKLIKEEEKAFNKQAVLATRPIPNQGKLFANISGKVVSASGESLVGVTILIKGKNRGTVTDLDGGFTLDGVESNDVLVFSYIGFLSQEVTVGNSSMISITLQEDSKALDEVVVTALGIRKEVKALGYSVTKIDGESFSKARDAVSKLDATKDDFSEADIAYGGDIAKWKKLGNSMMLRLGMRLSKVGPSTAETWVKKAVAGGVFTDNEDNLMISGTDATGTSADLANGMSWTISVGTRSPGKIAATFFDFLNDNNDPRLRHTVAVYTDPTNVGTKKTDPAIQKGLPNGLDRQTLEADPSYNPNSAGQEHQYSGVNRSVFAKLDGPRMFITNAEVQYMMAEAAVRGWISGAAASYNETGVSEAMKMLQQYDQSATITDQEIATYLTAHPFVGTSNMEAALEQINTQYWAATFLNGYEAFSNVRRSGYPVLTPINYPDNETGGLFPGRLRYPDNEPVLNVENYNAAVSRQGADNYITHVWWDIAN